MYSTPTSPPTSPSWKRDPKFLDRLTRFLDGDKTVKLPILTSCCPAWVKFFEHQFPDLIDIPSSAKSPQQMFGSIAKSFYADVLGIPGRRWLLYPSCPAWLKSTSVIVLNSESTATRMSISP